MSTKSPNVRTDRGDHFSCSMSAVLLARVEAFGGLKAVREVLRLAGSRRTVGYLLDITNWISYDEAVALWQAGARVTHHPQFARAVGVDAARRLGSSHVASMLRSLGAPENAYGAVAKGAAEFSTVTRLEVTEAGPGYAEVVAVAADGFPRSIEHCSWTCGLMTCPPVLFGLGPATVEHDECQAMGAARCVYRVGWNPAADPIGSSGQTQALRHQLAEMKERLHSVFATASDLIAVDDLDVVLARITARAALEVRAIRYLLAVQVKPEASRTATTRASRRRGSPSTWTSCSSATPRRIRTGGWWCRWRPTGASTAACSRCAVPARASSPRSGSCSRSTPVTRRARSTARPRWPRPRSAAIRRARCSRWRARWPRRGRAARSPAG